MMNFIRLLDAAAQTADNTAGRIPSENVDLMWATLVTGLVVVFLILILLVIVLWALGKVMNIKPKPKKSAQDEAQKASVPAPAPVPMPVPEVIEEDEDDDEIIAVIAAAIAAYGESEGKQYRIASVKRKEKAVRSSWGAAGIAENTRPF